MEAVDKTFISRVPCFTKKCNWSTGLGLLRRIVRLLSYLVKHKAFEDGLAIPLVVLYGHIDPYSDYYHYIVLELTLLLRWQATHELDICLLISEMDTFASNRVLELVAPHVVCPTYGIGFLFAYHVFEVGGLCVQVKVI